MQGSTAAGFALVFFAAASSAIAGSPSYPVLTELGRNVPGFGQSAGQAHAVSADFDGDGRLDVVVSGSAGSEVGSVLEVIGSTGGGIGIKQSLVVENPSYGLSLVAWTPSGQLPHLLTILDDGVVAEWSGWPLAQTRTFTIEPYFIDSAAVGDIDHDGNFELVTLGTQSGLVVYDIATGTQKWHLPMTSNLPILLADLDADSALEIVIGGPPGQIVDGATQAVEWSYPDGFGPALATGRFETGAAPQLIAGHQTGLITAFTSNPWSPIWDIKIDSPAEAIATGDLDGDGKDEIVEADGQWDSIHVFDAATRTERFSVANPSWGVSFLAVINPTGSVTPAITFSPDAYNSGDPLLSVASGTDGSLEYSVPNQPGPFGPPLLADVDGDGRLDLVYGESANASSVRIADATTGVEEWRLPEQQPGDPFSQFIPSAFLMAQTPTGKPQLILTGRNSYDSEVIALDGQSKAIRWRAGGTSDSTFRQHLPYGALAMDLDGDSFDDVVVCEQQTSTGGNRVFAFSGADGHLLWQSVAVGLSSHCVGMIEAFAVDRHLLVAVLSDGLYAFDPDTHLLVWTESTPIDGAISTRVDGRYAIVTFAGNAVSIYDASTHALLRSLQLDAPVSAIRSLDADSSRFVAAMNGRLTLIDGASGSVLATSDYLGEWGSFPGAPPSPGAPLVDVAGFGNEAYFIASTSQAGVFRHRAVLSERLFTDGFDPLPATAQAH